MDATSSCPFSLDSIDKILHKYINSLLYMDGISKEALSVLAYLYLEHFKFEKALRLLRILKQYFPDDLEIRRSLSYAYLKTGDFQAALQQAESSLRGNLSPKEMISSTIIKAKALWGLGKEEAARHTFTQIVHTVKLPKITSTPNQEKLEEE